MITLGDMLDGAMYVAWSAATALVMFALYWLKRL